MGGGDSIYKSNHQETDYAKALRTPQSGVAATLAFKQIADSEASQNLERSLRRIFFTKSLVLDSKN